MIQSKKEAIAILNDTSRAALDREKAIHVFQEQTLDQVELDAIINALSDNAAGVRWAAGALLAAHGRAVLPAVLRALMQPDCNSLLRTSIHHILHDNASADVSAEAKELLEALAGPASDVAAMGVASKWLQRLNEA